MDQFTKLGPVAALIKLWNDLTAPQRLVVIAFISVSAVVVLFIAMTASKPRMAVLFSNLSQEDAGAIAQKLSEQKIPYQLAASGTTIEVPASQVDELRLSMATQGLPQGGSVGFELFDKQSFGMTEFGEKVGYQRAIQGELKRTICSLAPVSDCKVLISLPDDSVFASEQQPATASIALKLRRGMPLSDEQVGGIVHLVASAVEGLRPENVTVVDGDGKMLSETMASSGGGGMLTTSQSKIKRQYESELAQNIQSMLAKVVGADKAVVRVTADMSFDKRQIKSEKYEPQGEAAAEARGIPIEEESRIERYNGGVLPPEGMPSSNENSEVVADGKDRYERSETTTRYEVTKTIEESVSAPGKLERLSVAVLVDDKIESSKMGAIREAVRAAAGISDVRGDQITVQKIAFDTETGTRMAKEMAKAEKNDMIMGLAKNGGAALLLIVFLLFLRKIIKGIKVQAPPEPAMAPAVDMGLISQMSNPADMFGGMDTRTYSQPEPVQQHEEVHTPPEPSLPVDVAQSSPEDLARLVKTWMAES